MVAFQLIDIIDSVLISVLKASEVSQVAKIETRLRKFCNDEWNKRARRAVDIASPMLLGNASVKQILDRIDPIFLSWQPAIQERYLSDIEKTYKLSRKAGWNQATGQTTRSLQYDTPHVKTPVKKAVPPEIANPVFDAIDVAAVESLQKKEVFWMNEIYTDGVQESIRKTAEDVIEQGRSSAFTVRELKKNLLIAGTTVLKPDGYVGSTKIYFEGVTANAVTVSRVQGQLKSFSDFEIKQFEISNPRDERTCIICGPMEGKVFTVEQGQRIAEAEIRAKTPDDVRGVHPWMNAELQEDGSLKLISRTDNSSIITKPGNVSAADSKALADAGYALPGYHFRCRCTIDAVIF